jgi:hypothetical protein
MPLGTGDFAYAYARARGVFHTHRTYRDDVVKQAKDAAKFGLRELRELRDVTRLPTGSKDLRERIVECLMQRWKRAQDRKRCDDKVWAPWTEEQEARRVHSINYVIQRYWDHGLRQHYGDGDFEGVELSNLIGGTPTLKREGYYTKNLSANVRRDFVSCVLAPRLLSVSERFILHADPVRDFAMPFGIRAAWRVLYAEPTEFITGTRSTSTGYVTTPGVVIEPEDRPRHLAKPEALAYGALMDGTSAYRKARRRVK